LGGRCSIDSKPGQGTKVHAIVPLVRSKADEKD
jgi:signal transduction histidine kinase